MTVPEQVVTGSTTIREIIGHPAFAGCADLLGLTTGEISPDWTLNDLYAGQGACAFADMPYGLNAAARRGADLFTPLHTPGQIAVHPDKGRSGLFFFPSGREGAPFSLVVPGGAYAMVAAAIEGFPTAARLNDLGINAFVLSYRTIYPPADGVFPQALEDLQAALHYIISHAGEYGIRADEYAVIGFSAGGHLTSMLATDTFGYQCAGLPKPGLLSLVYPVVEFSSAGEAIRLCRDCAFGIDAPEKHMELAYAPQHLHAGSPPVFLVHGKDDDTVPFEVSSPILQQAADAAGVPCRLLTFGHFPHGAGIGAGLEAGIWLEEMVRFWGSR